MAKITLWGMYDYDQTLFDLLTVPEGLDKDVLIGNILDRSGDFEILYPDFDYFKWAVGLWSRKWQPTMERWVKALAIEYDPLENYNRIESWTDSGSTSGTMSGNASGSTTGTTGSTTTGKVSAYDAGDSLTTRDQTEVNGSDSSTSSSTTGQTTSGTTSGTHSGQIHGNIGVTSSQQMLNQELELGFWNIYEKLTDLFLTEFVLPVY